MRKKISHKKNDLDEKVLEEPQPHKEMDKKVNKEKEKEDKKERVIDDDKVGSFRQSN